MYRIQFSGLRSTFRVQPSDNKLMELQPGTQVIEVPADFFIEFPEKFFDSPTGIKGDEAAARELLAEVKEKYSESLKEKNLQAVLLTGKLLLEDFGLKNFMRHDVSCDFVRMQSQSQRLSMYDTEMKTLAKKEKVPRDEESQELIRLEEEDKKAIEKKLKKNTFVRVRDKFYFFSARLKECKLLNNWPDELFHLDEYFKTKEMKFDTVKKLSYQDFHCIRDLHFEMLFKFSKEEGLVTSIPVYSGQTIEQCALLNPPYAYIGLGSESRHPDVLCISEKMSFVQAITAGNKFDGDTSEPIDSYKQWKWYYLHTRDDLIKFLMNVITYLAEKGEPLRFLDRIGKPISNKSELISAAIPEKNIVNLILEYDDKPYDLYNSCRYDLINVEYQSDPNKQTQDMTAKSMAESMKLKFADEAKYAEVKHNSAPSAHTILSSLLEKKKDKEISRDKSDIMQGNRILEAIASESLGTLCVKYGHLQSSINAPSAIKQDVEVQKWFNAFCNKKPQTANFSCLVKLADAGQLEILTSIYQRVSAMAAKNKKYDYMVSSFKDSLTAFLKSNNEIIKTNMSLRKFLVDDLKIDITSFGINAGQSLTSSPS